MADNYLENHYEEYERRKKLWQQKKRHLPKSLRTSTHQNIQRPDDEAL